MGVSTYLKNWRWSSCDFQTIQGQNDILCSPSNYTTFKLIYTHTDVSYNLKLNLKLDNTIKKHLVKSYWLIQAATLMQ